MTEPFSREEIEFIVSERIRRLGVLPNTTVSRQLMAASAAEGLQVARQSGYLQPLIVAIRTRMRDGRAEAQVWAGPEGAEDRPAWSRGGEGVSVVRT